MDDAEPQRASRFPAVPLADVLTRRLESVGSDAFAACSPITVHLDGQVSVRSRVHAFKGMMFAAQPGDVLFSKIDARNGAVTVLPPEITRAVVTPEFPVFASNLSRLDADFLKLLIRTGGFIRALAAKATGTSGRKRITPADFLRLAIPLPPLEQQRAIVAAHVAAAAEAARLDADAATAEAEALAAFEATLGLAAPPPLPDRPLFVARFRDLDRWSHEAALRRMVGANDAMSPTYPMVAISAVGRVTYGLQKCPANRPGVHARPYLRVANVQRERLDLAEVKTINVPDAELPRYRLEHDDLLLCEGNSMDLVGRGAIWKSEIVDCVHQNHILRVRLQLDRVSPEFALATINSRYGQAYFRSKAKRTTNLASINSKEVAAFELPLPPLEEQRRLVDALTTARQTAAEQRARAAAIRARARADFEAAVYELRNYGDSALNT